MTKCSWRRLSTGELGLVTFNVDDYKISEDRTARPGIRICRPGEFLRGLKWRPSATTLSAFRLR